MALIPWRNRVKPDRTWRVIGFVGVCVGMVMRLAALDRLALWADELASLQRSALPLTEHWPLIDKRPPLFELLLRVWRVPNISDIELRFPWAVCGVLAVWLTWHLGRRMAGEKGGAAAAWLMALSPLHLMFSRIARTYSMATLLAVLSMLLLWLWHTRKRRAYAAAYVVVTVAALHANVLMGGIVLGQNVFMLVTYGRDRRAVLRWILMQAVVGVLFAPWLWFSFLGATRFAGEAAYTPHQLGSAAKVAYLAFALCVGETVHPLNGLAVVTAFLGFFGTFVFAAIRCVKRDRSTGLFLAAPIACTLIPALFFAAVAPKHLMLILPLLAILLAIGLVRVKAKWLAVALAGMMAGPCLYGDVNYFARREFADASMVVPWRDMARIATQWSGEGGTVFIGWRTLGERFGSDKALFERYCGETRGVHIAYLSPDGWRAQVADALADRGRVALLLHRAEPRREIVVWLAAQGAVQAHPFLYDEETLLRMKEGGDADSRSSHVFVLYLVRRTAAGE